MRKEDPILLLTVEHPDVPPGDNANKVIAGLIREKLISLEINRSVIDPPTLKIELENRDLFWIDPRAGADHLVEEGVKITVLMGYAYATENGHYFGTPEQFLVSKVEGSSETFTVTGSCHMVALLGKSIVPRTFEEKSIGDIARRVIDDNGFDTDHRIIQDAKEYRRGVTQNAGETCLEFLRRLAKAINYQFFQTPHSDGTAIIHFHKPGFKRSGDRDVEVEEQTPDPKYGEGKNGNIAPIAGYIAYRYTEDTVRQSLYRSTIDASSDFTPNYVDSVPIIADVMSWRHTVKTPGTPQKVQALGIDLMTGEVINKSFNEGDLDSKSLSDKNIFVEGDDDLANFRLVQSMPVEVDDADTAEADAKAALETMQQDVHQIDVTIIGDPRLQIGKIWRFVGFAKFDGDYLLHGRKDKYDQEGFVSETIWTSDGVRGTSSTYKDTDRTGASTRGISVQVDDDVSRFTLLLEEEKSS